MDQHKENLNSIKTYLQGIITVCKGSPFAEYNKLILHDGDTFTQVVPSKSIDVMDSWRKSHKPKAKECFYNSQLFVATAAVGRYFEGYCFDGLLPFHHAWIVYNGLVVDFTLEARDRLLKRQKIKKTSGDPVYWGVNVPKHAIVKNIVETGISEPLAHKYYLQSKMRFL